MTHVTFLGGCQRVGASAVLVEQGSARLLIDYGVAFRGSPRVPLPTSTRNLAVVLSHAHLDHSGGLPLIAGSSGSSRVPVHMTPLTRRLLRILLEDMMRIGGGDLAFESLEVKRLLRYARPLNYGRPLQVNGKIQVTLRDAGHIPGSASVLVDVAANGGPTTRILYTGDLNTTDTRLVRGAPSPSDLEDLDLVIVESTYALEEHPPRAEVEQDFVESVRSVLENGGTALIPAFAVGRAQEVLCVLHHHRHHNLDYPIFLDGMARAVTATLLRASRSFPGGPLLERSLEQVTLVRRESDRRRALEEPAIIVAPAGMLKGGAATRYLRAIAKDKRSGIFLVGKQLPGTPGATLLEERTIPKHPGDPRAGLIKVKASVQAFDFSCHAGRSQLLRFLRQIPGNPTILTMHGEPKACQSLAATLRRKYGFDASAASNGQTIALN